MMKTIIFLVLCLLALTKSLTNSFSSKLLVKTVKPLRNSISSSKLYVKSASNPNDYWEGEWICADCGYVYDRDIDGGGLYFEELKKGFICPQCSAPRKRYAKKVGDTWGVTRDGGDFPIYAITFVGLAITTWFALVYVPTL